MPRTRQLDRSGSGWPWISACSRTTSQAFSSAANPPGIDADNDSRPAPSLPASRGPDGENMAAVSISGYGWVYGRSCSWASRSVNQDVSRLIRSCGVARSSARIASSDSSCMRLWSTGSIPIM
ncbi:Uncharacterised protein [Mycobacteroides abscessus subsp. abscessus]|nr:Uncharacterised protein [Mycobacteroides abscessus subsp. abscessus]